MGWIYIYNRWDGMGWGWDGWMDGWIYINNRWDGMGWDGMDIYIYII